MSQPQGRRPALIYLALGACGLLFVWHFAHYAFLQDDAFIFLRYARNAADGQGLVWNPGERVEGYTSFLWVLILTGISLVSSRPEGWLVPMGLLLGLTHLGLALELGRRAGGGIVAGLAVVALLASDRNFAVWSSSGMETRLYGLLVTAVWLLVFIESQGLREAPRRRWREALLALALVLLSWTRPEGIMVSGLAMTALWFVRGERRPSRGVAAALVWLAMVLGHELWRLWYYGQPLPNTFHAKVGSGGLGRGLAYYTSYFSDYPLHALLFAGVVFGELLQGRPRRAPFALALFLVLYCGYVLAVGGDFMEYRFLEPIMPLAWVLVVVRAGNFVRQRLRPERQAAAGAALLLALVALNLYSGFSMRERAETIQTRDRLWIGTQLWRSVGEWFGEHALPGESIAVGAAGAIPYYSGLYAVDSLGLNDPNVRQWPANPLGLAGHLRHVPWPYLERKRIDWVIGNPDLAGPEMDFFKPLGPRSLILRIEDVHLPFVKQDYLYLHVETTRERSKMIKSLRKRGLPAWIAPDRQVSP